MFHGTVVLEFSGLDGTRRHGPFSDYDEALMYLIDLLAREKPLQMAFKLVPITPPVVG